MVKPVVHNHRELMEEKERLTLELQKSKEAIRDSFLSFKNELNPFSRNSAAKKSFFKVKASATNPLVKFGIRRATDLLVGKFLLKRAGWLPRLIVPFLIRQITTKLVSNKAEKKIARALHRTASSIREADLPVLKKISAKPVGKAK